MTYLMKTVTFLLFISLSVQFKLALASSEDSLDQENSAVDTVITKLINRIKKSGIESCLDVYKPSICKLASEIAKSSEDDDIDKKGDSVQIIKEKKEEVIESTKKPKSFKGFQLITETEFDNAFIFNGFPEPSKEHYKFFTSQLTSKGNITSKREAAMFLAQIIFESGGLRFKSEIACLNGGCKNVYPRTIGLPDKQYYGRGYIQLTHDFNYKEASLDLYRDLRLLKDPDQVADSDEIAWATAFWFWKKNVGKLPEVKQGKFGASTKALNGPNECKGEINERALNRFKYYAEVLRAFNIEETPDETGCYNK